MPEKKEKSAAKKPDVDEESEEETEETSADDDGEERDDDAEDGAADDEPAGERDASTKGVAKALGVDSDDDEDSSEEDEAAEAKPNRAQRRREEALRRRAAREGGAKGAEATKAVPANDADEKLPKDKNARAKELLKRRQESASGKRVTKLDASEMVQDSLARAGSATTKWLRDHVGLVVGVLLVGVGGAVGYSLWTSHKDGVAAAASDQLDKGLVASQGYVSSKGDTRGEDEKKADPVQVFPTLEARADAQLAAYKVVIDQHPGTGPAILAKLGEGTAYLDESKWDDAIAAFSAVIGSPLATADLDVKGRAIEGLGFAKEGKGDIDGATAAFKDLEGVGVKGFDDLGKYHQARMLLKKGEIDQAKELFVALQKKLEVPTLEGTESQYVKEAVTDYLKRIDPTLVKKTPSIGGLHGSSFTPEDLKDLDATKMRKLQEMLMRQQQQGDNHGLPMPGDKP